MEYITYEAQLPFGSNTYCQRGRSNVPLHCHVDFYEFALFTTGKTQNVYKQEEEVCTFGTVLFFRPGESHKLVPLTSNNENFSFTVKKEYFEDYFKNIWPSRKHYASLDALPLFISKKVPFAQFMFLSHLASALAYNISPERTSIAEQLLGNLLYAILDDIPIGNTEGIDFYVNDLMRCFDSCSQLETDITTIVAHFPVSYQTLSNHFKKLTGYTMAEYRNKRRMEYAAHLLARENYTISRVADILHITCQSYFIKQFKKQFGMTPKQYQLQCQNKDYLT